MDIYIIRRTRLQELIDTKYGGSQADMSRATGIKAPHLNRWLSLTSPDRRPITEPSARNIEAKAGIPPGWLDATGNIIPDEAELSAMFLSLDQNDRALVLEQVRAIKKLRGK